MPIQNPFDISAHEANPAAHHAKLTFVYHGDDSVAATLKGTVWTDLDMSALLTSGCVLTFLWWEVYNDDGVSYTGCVVRFQKNGTVDAIWQGHDDYVIANLGRFRTNLAVAPDTLGVIEYMIEDAPTTGTNSGMDIYLMYELVG